MLRVMRKASRMVQVPQYFQMAIEKNKEQGRRMCRYYYEPVNVIQASSERKRACELQTTARNAIEPIGYGTPEWYFRIWPNCANRNQKFRRCCLSNYIYKYVHMGSGLLSD